MKKFTSFVVILIVSITALFAQTTVEEPKATAGDQISEVVTTLFDKTTEAVQSMAEALKVPAEHVYTILVRQQVIQATYLLCTTLLCLFIGLFLVQFSIGRYRKECLRRNIKEYGNDTNKYRNYPVDMEDDWWLTGAIIGVIISIVSLIVLVCVSGSVFTGFFNPEYGAIQDIMNLIK